MHASWAATPLKHSHFEHQAGEVYVEVLKCFIYILLHILYYIFYSQNCK